MRMGRLDLHFRPCEECPPKDRFHPLGSGSSYALHPTRQNFPKNDKMITLRNQQVILDSDVAELYDVETRDINKAVKNNPSKFPNGYIIELDATEKHELVENFHRFERQKHSTVNPKAFTEKGLYMLATILKGPKAEETTIA